MVVLSWLSKAEKGIKELQGYHSGSKQDIKTETANIFWEWQWCFSNQWSSNPGNSDQHISHFHIRLHQRKCYWMLPICTFHCWGILNRARCWTGCRGVCSQGPFRAIQISRRDHGSGQEGASHLPQRPCLTSENIWGRFDTLVRMALPKLNLIKIDN